MNNSFTRFCGEPPIHKERTIFGVSLRSAFDALCRRALGAGNAAVPADEVAPNDPADATTIKTGLTILIPGTDWQTYGGWTPSSNALFTCANGPAKLLVWSPSRNNDSDRLTAAEKLRHLIAAHQFAPGAKLQVITHSHGGNVALAASRLGFARPIDTLIALNKPQMDAEIYQPGENIRAFYNISTQGFDWIQYGGSSTKGHYKTDPRAINKLIDTSSSPLKKHAAMIWDDQIRQSWWQWLIEQEPTLSQQPTPQSHDPS